jgi:hypothetical protein
MHPFGISRPGLITLKIKVIIWHMAMIVNTNSFKNYIKCFKKPKGAEPYKVLHLKIFLYSLYFAPATLSRPLLASTRENAMLIAWSPTRSSVDTISEK